jgi:hypothetical protein
MTLSEPTTSHKSVWGIKGVWILSMPLESHLSGPARILREQKVLSQNPSGVTGVAGVAGVTVHALHAP